VGIVVLSGAGHWSEGLRVQIWPRALVFKGNENLKHDFLQRESKADSPIFYGMLKNPSKHERYFVRPNL
jgi:hypothetical protein